MAKHRIAESERAGELVQRLLVAFHVQQNVVGLVDLGDWIGELATAPVFHAMNLAAVSANEALVAFDHRGDLLGLVRMDQEYDLIVPHGSSLRIGEPPIARRCVVWQGDWLSGD